MKWDLKKGELRSTPSMYAKEVHDYQVQQEELQANNYSIGSTFQIVINFVL